MTEADPVLSPLSRRWDDQEDPLHFHHHVPDHHVLGPRSRWSQPMLCPLHHRGPNGDYGLIRYGGFPGSPPIGVRLKRRVGMVSTPWKRCIRSPRQVIKLY